MCECGLLTGHRSCKTRCSSSPVLTLSAHRDAVRDANRVVLPRQHVLLLDGLLDNVSKVEHWTARLSNGFSLQKKRQGDEAGRSLTMRAAHSRSASSTQNFWNSGGTKRYSLARVTLPPHGRDADMGRVLHHVPVRDAGAVEHGLQGRQSSALCQPTITFKQQNEQLPGKKKSEGAPLVGDLPEHPGSRAPGSWRATSG